MKEDFRLMLRGLIIKVKKKMGRLNRNDSYFDRKVVWKIRLRPVEQYLKFHIEERTTTHLVSL